jgi:hypothetical protein
MELLKKYPQPFNSEMDNRILSGFISKPDKNLNRKITRSVEIWK